MMCWRHQIMPLPEQPRPPEPNPHSPPRTSIENPDKPGTIDWAWLEEEGDRIFVEGAKRAAAKRAAAKLNRPTE